MTEPTILWLDLETTGLDPGVDQIVEVAALVESLSGKHHGFIAARIKFDASKASPEALARVRYTEERWMCAPGVGHFARWAMTFRSLGPMVLAGHNPAFDRGFLDRIEFPVALDYHMIDTVGIAAAMMRVGAIKGDSLALADVARELEIPHVPHDAWSDMMASREIFRKASVKLF